MKWKTIVPGTIRIVQRFAWLPAKLSDGYTVWLERYYCVERRVFSHKSFSSFWFSEYKTQNKYEADIKLNYLNP